MKFRYLALGVVTGLAAAVVAKEVTNRVAPHKSANEVLNIVKEQFKKQAPIDGSWVYMKPETYTNGYAEVPVYKGGISRVVNGEMENYEFAADAKTGFILELQQV